MFKEGSKNRALLKTISTLSLVSFYLSIRPPPASNHDLRIVIRPGNMDGARQARIERMDHAKHFNRLIDIANRCSD